MAVRCIEDWQDRESIHLPIDRAASDDDKLVQILALTARTWPLLDAVIQDMRHQLSIASEANAKRPETIRQKATRARTLEKYPWFRIEHVRDTLRFRSRIATVEQVARVIGFFDGHDAVEIVKIDLDKFATPNPWGWRMVAVDLRFKETGHLVEYYMTFPEVMEANEGDCHEFYEAFRDLDGADLMDPNVQQAFLEAVEQARAQFDRAWAEALARLGLSEAELVERLDRIKALLGRR